MDANLGLMRFVLCGSVDDGKSTLIGRLLFDAGLIYEDHLLTLAEDSRKSGITGQYDFSFLSDGLIAEREQRITIDVAYRYFSTPKRAFIVADAPGHPQYTRNMITASSTADVAVMLVDARKGIITQTRRHSMILAFLGIKELIVLINKMDLIDYSQHRFEELKEEYAIYMRSLGIAKGYFIPISATQGDNVVSLSSAMPWYTGSPLLDYLEKIPVHSQDKQQAFRMNVQWVNRPNDSFRGFSGKIAAGRIRVGDQITVLPAGQRAVVNSITLFNETLEQAQAGQSITLTFNEPIDISRGDLLASSLEPCPLADQIHAELFWMAPKSMVVGRQYSLRIGTLYLSCSISKLDYIIDTDSLQNIHASELNINQIGLCTLLLDREIAFEPYEKNRELGGFLIIDKAHNAILAAGVIRRGLQRSLHIPHQLLTVNQAMRAAIKWQKPLVLWFVGLSGSGKSTLADLLEKRLHAAGHHTMILDANNMRHGLNKNLDFTDTDRIENARRIAEVAKLLCEAGLITLVACIAPFNAERSVIRQLIGKEYFREIFVDSPLKVVEQRDSRGLYAKARTGEIQQFTGVSSVFEPPEAPDLHLDMLSLSLDAAVDLILNKFFSKSRVVNQL